MLIKLKKDYANKKAGQSFDLDPAVAVGLVQAGKAERVSPNVPENLVQTITKKVVGMLKEAAKVGESFDAKQAEQEVANFLRAEFVAKTKPVNGKK